jgi:hypothetical protein
VQQFIGDITIINDKQECKGVKPLLDYLADISNSYDEKLVSPKQKVAQALLNQSKFRENFIAAMNINATAAVLNKNVTEDKVMAFKDKIVHRLSNICNGSGSERSAKTLSTDFNAALRDNAMMQTDTIRIHDFSSLQNKPISDSQTMSVLYKTLQIVNGHRPLEEEKIYGSPISSEDFFSSMQRVCSDDQKRHSPEKFLHDKLASDLKFREGFVRTFNQAGRSRVTFIRNLQSLLLSSMPYKTYPRESVASLNNRNRESIQEELSQLEASFLSIEEHGADPKKILIDSALTLVQDGVMTAIKDVQVADVGSHASVSGMGL